MTVTQDYKNLTDPSVLSTITRALRDRIALCRAQLDGTTAGVGVSLNHHKTYWQSELAASMDALKVAEGAAHA